ncbi:MAG: excinuclease subunit UvrA, partial [Actinomycetota bacterium]
PRLFSFNSPVGACPSCGGLGHVDVFDPERVVAFPSLSLASGAIKGWDRRNAYTFSMLESVAAHYGFDLEDAFEDLAQVVEGRDRNASLATAGCELGLAGSNAMAQRC